MKRRSSSQSLSVQKSKKSCCEPTEESRPCILVRIVQQYGLLEAIVANLEPKNLLALLCTSKDMYRSMLPQPNSLRNLRSKMHCPGEGVRIRKRYHKCFASDGWKEHVQCASTTDHDIESRPCGECGVTTCNECRIHCVYQSNFEECCEEDELHNYSGHVLLDPLEAPILSPAHLKSTETNKAPRWQNPCTGECQPYHDLGWLDVPYEDDSYGPPELIDDILDLDLGQNSFALSASSNVSDPSPVLAAFHLATEKRKRVFCDDCLPPQFSASLDDLEPRLCHCTLRKQFLDRWVCLPCYEKAEASLNTAYTQNTQNCKCGAEVGKSICLWCSGAVLGPTASD